MFLRHWIAAIVFFPATGIAQDAINPEGLSGQAGRPYSPYADRAYPTEVYFGDTHVHTGLSGDAGGGGTRLMPRDAYRFAVEIRSHRILVNLSNSRVRSISS